MFLSRFQSHYQKCLYLVFTIQDDEKESIENQKTLIETIVNELHCKCEKDLKYNLCMNRYCLLIDSNFGVLFENILTERNLYLRYFAYSDSNLLRLITALFDKYKNLTEYQNISKTLLNENKNGVLFSNVENYSIDNSKLEIGNNDNTITNTDISNKNNKLNAFLNVCALRNFSFLIREITNVLIKLLQNMIIDVGLSDGIIDEEEDIIITNTNTSNLLESKLKKSDLVISPNKLNQLKDNNNKLDLEKCLIKLENEHDSTKNQSSLVNLEEPKIIIPKPYLKPREFILKEENYETDLSEDEEDEEDVKNIKKELYKSQPIAYKSNEPYNVTKELFQFIINNFNNQSIIFQERFGLNNIIELELIILIIELLCDLNYTINVNNLIEEHRRSGRTRIVEDQETVDKKTVIRNFKKKTTLNNDKRILQFIKSNEVPWELKKNFIFSEEKIEYVLNNKPLLCSFYKNLIDCFIKFEDNSILHKQFEYLVQFLFSDFCPKELADTFIEESCILETIVKSCSSFAIAKRNLANICEIATLIFLATNSKVQKALNTSKSYIYNTI